MTTFGKSVMILLAFILMSVHATDTPKYMNQLVGSAFLENKSYSILKEMCDLYGGRLAGTEPNEKAIALLKDSLQSLGCSPKLERFRMPGWRRMQDEVMMLQPLKRKLRAAALGYVQKKPTFEAEVVFIGFGLKSEFESAECRDKIALVTSERYKGTEKRPYRFEVIRRAAQNSCKAVLFINRKPGELLLAGTGSFQGEPTPVPAYSITYEEGQWINRLLEDGREVKLSVTTESYCQPIESSNIRVKIPGQHEDKIVIGAHIDSWDLGQGGIDNGLGTAILFELARLFQNIHPQSNYTVEFVWFNGEELGLWGSKRYVQRHREDPIKMMMNLDMTGTPTGFNVMGFDEYMPVFEQILDQLNALDLKRGVVSRPWINSDHSPFMLAGIPSITPLAHLDDTMVKYYHSFGDTFDKVDKTYLAEASAVLAITISYLANNTEIDWKRLSSDETRNLMIKHNLKDQLQRQGAWPFN
ncbi:MAG: M28 family peptidase [Caldithrix sp.]|nr:M28 family peptidase [Caldithrix sp.]